MMQAETPRRATSNCLLHVQNRRGEFVIFDNQGHDRDWMVVVVWEEGRERIERRVRRWSNEAYCIYQGARALVYGGPRVWGAVPA